MAENQDPHMRAAKAVHEGRPVDSRLVRQGRGGRRIIWVLVVGLALAALATFGLWLRLAPGMEAINEGGNVEQHQFSTGAPQPVERGELDPTSPQNPGPAASPR